MLKSSTYSEIWTKPGYPEKPTSSSLEGSVIHKALEVITNTFVTHNCSNQSSPEAPGIMKTLGGISSVLTKCVQSSLAELNSNPRAIIHIEHLGNTCLRNLPNLRFKTQTMLSRVNLAKRQSIKNPIKRIGTGAHAHPQKLKNGSYTEFKILIEELKFIGIIDILTITEDSCEIRDFKTGEMNDKHISQVKIYALLWYLDSLHNPNHRRIDKITLSYKQGDVSVPAPNVIELNQLKVDLIERLKTAKKNIIVSKPQSYPSHDNCSFCQVRQLCNHYWQFLESNTIENLHETSQYMDLQLKLLRTQGRSSWNAEIESSSALKSKTQIVFKCRIPPFDLYSGQTLRVLNIPVGDIQAEYEGESNDTTMATYSKNTEVFLIP